MKVPIAALIISCMLALALGNEEIELNSNGCPVDPTVYFILPHDTYCNLFNVCNGGNRIEHRCPDGLVFNTYGCDWPEQVDCHGKDIAPYVPEKDKEETNPGGNSDPSLAASICAREDSEGVLVAHENCSEFYKCNQGLPVTFQCTDGLLYNYNEGRCDWPDNVECGNRLRFVVSIRDACTKEDSDGILLNHENCNQFYKCSSGAPVAFFCPSGLLYNIDSQVCDWEINVDCAGRPIVEADKDEDNNGSGDSYGGNGHSDPSQAPAICAAEDSDGVLVAHEDCNKFYKCYLGLPVAIDCPLNLLYNPKREYCDWPENVECGDRNNSRRR